MICANAIAERLAYQASKPSSGKEAKEAAASAAAAAVVGIDEDGDGVPDMAVPIVFSVGGGAMPGGAHAEKLGTYLPQQNTTNDRPFYAHESNPSLLLWWSKDRWWLGKRDELGRNRGWLKVKCKDFVPPEKGWIVYNTKEKTWCEATDLKCTNGERIVMGGETPDNAHAEKLGEFCKTADVINDRPAFCRETRPNLMLWWAGGRWWLGKREELGTNRGWVKCHSEAMSPLELADGQMWLVYSSAQKKWLSGDKLWCKVNDEFVPSAAAAAASAAGPEKDADAPKIDKWEVHVCSEGDEPEVFWSTLGGKQKYAAGGGGDASSTHEPRLFECSDQTGAFRVEEVLDFSQEDLEHTDVYILIATRIHMCGSGGRTRTSVRHGLQWRRPQPSSIKQSPPRRPEHQEAASAREGW